MGCSGDDEPAVDRTGAEPIAFIGTNTTYNIDPEEVMADHFTLLVLGTPVPEPSFLAQAKIILQQKGS